MLVSIHAPRLYRRVRPGARYERSLNLLADEFTQYRTQGFRMGFRHVESGPLVRSSYHAGGAI